LHEMREEAKATAADHAAAPPQRPAAPSREPSPPSDVRKAVATVASRTSSLSFEAGQAEVQRVPFFDGSQMQYVASPLQSGKSDQHLDESLAEREREEELRRLYHIPGMFSHLEEHLHPPPPPLSKIGKNLLVRSSRAQSSFLVPKEYHLNENDAEALFRVFECFDEGLCFTNVLTSSVTPEPQDLLQMASEGDSDRKGGLVLPRWQLPEEQRAVSGEAVRQAFATLCIQDHAREAKHFMQRFDRFNKGQVSCAGFKQVLRWEADSLKTSLMERIFLTFEEPSSSQLSFATSWFIMGLIVLSALAFVMETVPIFRDRDDDCDDTCTCDSECEPMPKGSVFFLIDVICVAAFTVEYLARICTVGFCRVAALEADKVLPLLESERGRLRKEEDPGDVTTKLRRVVAFALRPMSIIDLVAILPFYLQLATPGGASGLTVLRVLRLARVLRVLKLGKYNVWVLLMVEVLVESLPGLQILAFVGCLAVVLLGSVAFFLEQGRFVGPGTTLEVDDDGVGAVNLTKGTYTRPDVFGDGREISPFRSIPRSMWYVMVTGPTVGYGDLFPTTRLGKVLGTVLCMGTMLVIAFPVTVIATQMSLKYDILMGTPPPLDPFHMPSFIRRQCRAYAIRLSFLKLLDRSVNAKQISVDDAYWLGTFAKDLCRPYITGVAAVAGSWEDSVSSGLCVLPKISHPVAKQSIQMAFLALALTCLQ